MSIFTTKLRTLVSQDRIRHHDEEASVNIDLTYITDRVLAMSFPATGIEAAWRNDIQDVCRLLQTKHKNNFLVFNLSERDYEYDLLDNQIVCFPFKDHHAPPLHIIFQIIFNIDSWLKANPQHVAIVHCIGGKGRTGLIVVCYLFFCGMYAEVDKCLEHFAHARSQKGKGVTQPSQLRYVRYFCGIVSNKLQMSLNPLILTKVSVGPVPKGFYVFVEFYPQLYAETHSAYTDDIQDNLIFSTFANPESRGNVGSDARYTTECNVELSGDILVRGYIVGLKESKSKARMFRMQFHTGLVHRGEIAIPKAQLDDLNKEKKKFSDFELRLTFDSSDCPRNSILVYNMIFSQMKAAFIEQQKKISEDPDYAIKQNTLRLSNDSPNNSLTNFTTVTDPNNPENNATNTNKTNNKTSTNKTDNTTANNKTNTSNKTANNTSNTNNGTNNHFPTTSKKTNNNNDNNNNKHSKPHYHTLRETRNEGKGAKGGGFVGTYRMTSIKKKKKKKQLLDNKEEGQKIEQLLEKQESFTNPDPPLPPLLPPNPNRPSATNPPPSSYSFIPAVPTTHPSSYAAAASILSSPSPLSASVPSLPSMPSLPLSSSSSSPFPSSSTSSLPPPSLSSSSSAPTPSFSTLVSLLSRSTSYRDNPRASGLTLASPREHRERRKPDRKPQRKHEHERRRSPKPNVYALTPCVTPRQPARVRAHCVSGLGSRFGTKAARTVAPRHSFRQSTSNKPKAETDNARSLRLNARAHGYNRQVFTPIWI
eukprot:Phypoly_transcript_02980.p1 GENE.Phypoly_transcript_02980~~Phypoly_transcript_02980.p1  ORF type:complete len:760 (+),score=184.73 Phypoly_transcript_02980:180-2459(+)